MKKLIMIALSALLVGCATTSHGSATHGEKDTGVGKNGVALLSSPSFKKGGVPVDMFNIVRAETAKYFAEEIILSGGNRMRHERTGIDLKNQTVIRSNFDLIYSYGVYDVSGGLEVTVPEYDLYQIVHIFDENHITLAVVYPGDTVKLSQDDVTYGNHVYLFMRTQRRTADAAGLKELNKRQDAVFIKAGSNKPYVSEVKYDPETFNKLRKHLIGPYGIKNAIIYKGFVDNLEDIVFPHYQMVNLGGWAGLPAKHAFYFVVVSGDEGAKNGKPSSMTFSPPPVQYGKNGYWSLTLYNEQGWVATEKFNTNSHKATPNADGSYTLNFNTPGAINNLDVVENWNGLFRCYLPESVDSILEFKAEVMQGLPASDSGRTTADSAAKKTPRPVNLMTVVQAESELMFKKAIARAGGVNKFDHGRKPATPKTQKIVRSQSDMLYSHGVFDASEGLTVTMPEPMTGYHSLHLFDASHAQLGVVYSGETRTIKPGDISTTDKHVYALMRTSTDAGLETANRAQDLVKVKAAASAAYVGPGYDEEQLAQAKRFLAAAVPAGLVKAKTAYANEVVPGTTLLKDGTDIEKFHYISSSLLGWALMPNEDAYYPQLGIKESGCTAVSFPKPPVQYDKGGYWSFTAYGIDGYLRTEKAVISCYEAKANADGTYTVHVGNSETCRTHDNRLEMPEGGASITLRLYRPTSISDARAFEAKFRSDNAGK